MAVIAFGVVTVGGCLFGKQLPAAVQEVINVFANLVLQQVHPSPPVLLTCPRSVLRWRVLPIVSTLRALLLTTGDSLLQASSERPAPAPQAAPKVSPRPQPEPEPEPQECSGDAVPPQTSRGLQKLAAQQEHEAPRTQQGGNIDENGSDAVCHWEVVFGKVSVRTEPRVDSARRTIKLRGDIVLGRAVDCPNGGCHWVELTDEAGYMLSNDPSKHGQLLRCVEQPN